MIEKSVKSTSNKTGTATPMQKMADAYRKLGWVLITAGSVFGVTTDEKHLIRGVLMWGVCQIAAYLFDELDRSSFGPSGKR